MPDAGESKRNIEIKAKLADESEFNEKVAIASQLTGEKQAEIIVQHDVFFNVPNGRLKLRYEVSWWFCWIIAVWLSGKFRFFQGNGAKLVQYSRDDVAGPKLSKFNLIEVSDGALMERMLHESCGTLGDLDKTRHLFIHEGRTRIHLDVVKNKGANYYGMEFEVMLKPSEDLELGNQIAEELMTAFKLRKDQLLEGSYFEILNTA